MTVTPPPAAPPSTPPPKKSAGRNIVVVMAGTLGSRLTGIFRQQIINAFPSHLTDAFLLATRVPNTLRELLAEGALVNAFIPVYKSLDEDGRRTLAQAFSGVLIAVNLLLLALGILAAPWIAGLLVPPGSPVSFELVVYMTRLLVPFLMLISLSAIAMGLLNADEHFRESSFAPVAFNLASIAVLLVTPKNATWLALGWLVGGFAQLIVQLPSLARFGLLPTPALRSHAAMRRVLVNMAPFTLTAGARQILNFYVQRLLAGPQYPSGTVTGYNNAETLFTLANGLFVVSPALAYFRVSHSRPASATGRASGRSRCRRCGWSRSWRPRRVRCWWRCRGRRSASSISAISSIRASSGREAGSWKAGRWRCCPGPSTPSCCEPSTPASGCARRWLSARWVSWRKCCCTAC